MNHLLTWIPYSCQNFHAWWKGTLAVKSCESLERQKTICHMSHVILQAKLQPKRLNNCAKSNGFAFLFFYSFISFIKCPYIKSYANELDQQIYHLVYQVSTVSVSGGISCTRDLRSATCSTVPEGTKTWKTVGAELMLSGAKVSGLAEFLSVTGKFPRFGDGQGEIICKCWVFSMV